MTECSKYEFLYATSNNIEVYEKSVPRTKKILNHAVRFEAGEEDRIAYRTVSLRFNFFKKVAWLSLQISYKN